MTPHILIIEDDIHLAQLISAYLGKHGYQVSLHGRGDTAADVILDTRPDLVILDVMLPGKEGFDVCREVRLRYHGRILIMTARDEDVDEILGLELGADDYLAKPCDPRELTARLRAVLRRSHPVAASSQLELGDLCFSPIRGVATIDEQDISLTVSESRLLEALLKQPGEPLDKQELAQIALGRKLTLYDRSLDMHVSNLRKKIGPHPDGRPRIVALRSRGYYYSL